MLAVAGWGHAQLSDGFSYGTFRCNDSVVNHLYRQAIAQFDVERPPYPWQLPEYYFMQRWLYGSDFTQGMKPLPDLLHYFLYPYASKREERQIYRQLNHFVKLARKGQLTLHDMDPLWQQRSAGYSEACSPDSNIIALSLLSNALRYYLNTTPYNAQSIRLENTLEDLKDTLSKHSVPVQKNNPMKGHPLYVQGGYMGNGTLEANALGTFVSRYSSNNSPYTEQIVRNVLVEKGGHHDIGPLTAHYLLHGLQQQNHPDIAWLLLGNRVARDWTFLPAPDTVLSPLWRDRAIPFLYNEIAGIEPLCQYYQAKRDSLFHFNLMPNFSLSDLTFVEATMNTPHGVLLSRWEKRHGVIYWHIEIPPQSCGTIYLHRKLHGGERYDHIFGDVFSPNTKEFTAGSYDFEIPYLEQPFVFDEFLYNDAPFEQCHAATIVETPNGDLLSAFYGGHHEGGNDVCIWLCRKTHGQDDWSAPQRVAGGDGLPCWNPVLFQIPNGDLLLFYKRGSQVSQWTGWLLRSSDGGQTWSQPEPLPDGLLGPAKNKPLYSNGRIICPASDEKEGWKVYFEYSDDQGRTWQRTPFVEAPNGIQAIQPSLLPLKDGRLMAFCRTQQSRVALTTSNDNGTTWTPLRLTKMSNNNSGFDVCRLSDSAYYMVCNNWPLPQGMQNPPRTPLSILFSKDGIHWKWWETLENSPIGEYSYPSVIPSSDGRLQIVYTWRRQRIKYVCIDPTKKQRKPAAASTRRPKPKESKEYPEWVMDIID